jgi:hypothetical protein
MVWIIWGFTVFLQKITQGVALGCFDRGAMATAKTTTLTFRIEPGLKDARCARGGK